MDNNDSNCKQFTICRQTVINWIASKVPLSWDEIQNKVLANKGVFLICVGNTLGDYIEDLETKGVIKYNPKIDKYNVIGFKNAYTK